MVEHPYNSIDKEVERIAYLIAGYIRDTLTEREHDELDKWVNAGDQNMQLFEELTDEKNIWANLSWMDKVKARELYKKMKESGSFQIPEKLSIRRRRIRALWIAAASAVLVGCLYVIYRNGMEAKPVITKTSTQQMDTASLNPGGNRATLTLEDGRIVDLALVSEGVLKEEKEAEIRKIGDGELVYELNHQIADAAGFHSLSTPVGGQFQVRLPDGTRVWLNASSVLRYPSRFEGSERRVELNGEAYFEVSKNEKQPFRVQFADSASVTVLGTHFNVQAYREEANSEVTLLEGKVSVERNSRKQQLLPGMQASLSGNMIKTVAAVDTEEVTGWKNGLFVFHDAPIEVIMNQVARWYNAKVVYQAKIRQDFNATILRKEPLSKLLHLLELNGYVHFKIENNTIYVLP